MVDEPKIDLSVWLVELKSALEAEFGIELDSLL